MARLIAALLLLLSLTPAALANWEHKPTRPHTNRILIVVDVSGSMKKKRFDRAYSQVMSLVRGPVDDAQIGILAFDGGTYRWSGLLELHCPPCLGRSCKMDSSCKHPPCTRKTKRCVPDNYASIPNKLDHVLDALFSTVRQGGSTNVLDAMYKAMHEPRKDLTIVLISDGDFHGSTSEAELLTFVGDWQKWRKTRHALFCKNGKLPETARGHCKGCLGEATIMTFNVSRSPSLLMSELGKLYGGGAWRFKYDPKAPKDKNDSLFPWDPDARVSPMPFPLPPLPLPPK